MRVRYSFSSRRTRTIDPTNKHKIAFPKIARHVILQSDIILEILDSRFWRETRNLEFEEEIKKLGKKIIFILNKSDLVDKKKLIKEMGEDNLYPRVLVSCKMRKGSSELREIIKIEAKKTGKERSYIGVIGYPNTGKSSVINLLVGKSSARVAPEPGFTKGMQKIKLTENIFLFDTPGVIPSSEDSNINKRDLVKHALINVRGWNKVKEPEMIVHNLMQKYPGVLEKFYDLEAEGDSEILVEKLGRKKGFLVKGNLVDTNRTSRLILKDFQEGKIRV
jgi:ribosome biogenesis GTPase A